MFYEAFVKYASLYENRDGRPWIQQNQLPIKPMKEVNQAQVKIQVHVQSPAHKNLQVSP